MRLIRDPSGMQEWSQQVRARGESIAFVPTMGFLHEGHVSLMRAARERADHVVASIFVNPLQFGPHEDLDRYPRDEEGDLRTCAAAGCAAVFLPTAASMYPEGFQTQVRVGPLGEVLCGRSRPGHFDGVATVVLKLLLVVRPQIAVFGGKDYQQVQVIRRMVRDLCVDVEVVTAPTIREADGLALSSRNAYLTPELRQQATALSRALAQAEVSVAQGERDPTRVVAAVRAVIEAAARAEIDYVAIVDPETLQESAAPLVGPTLVALAVRFGATRLIDNRVLSP